MSVTDPIANMLTIIRNGIRAQKDTVDIPSSNIKLAIVKILKDNNYIDNFKIIRDNKQNTIHIILAYKDGKSKINTIKRISKPSLRIYKRSQEMKKILNGYGIAIISTSKGIITDQQARQQKLGGEIICHVW